MKRRNKVLITAMLLASVALAGCGQKISNYIDEDTASAIASIGKSYVTEKGAELVSEVVENSTEFVSNLTSEVIENADNITKDVQAAESEEKQSDAAAKENSSKDKAGGKTVSYSVKSGGKLNSPSDINLHATDDNGIYYAFTYDGEEYSAWYITDHWKIYDSYKITNSNDMIMICQALIDENPVHGADMDSYRTANDMAFEWVQHNLAYEFLPDDGNKWKLKSKDVDFNPEDQGKSFIEIYEERTGKKFSFTDFLGWIYRHMIVK